MKKKYVLKNKKKFVCFILVFSISLICFTMIYSNSASGYKQPQYKSVLVKPGDTLWSIAKEHGHKGDIRRCIHTIAKINNINCGMLYANTVIQIPIDE